MFNSLISYFFNILSILSVLVGCGPSSNVNATLFSFLVLDLYTVLFVAEIQTLRTIIITNVNFINCKNFRIIQLKYQIQNPVVSIA